jgi:hypothetical protein
MESSFHHIVLTDVRNTITYFLPLKFSITLNIISVLFPSFREELISDFTLTCWTLNEFIAGKVDTLKVNANLCIDDKIVIKLGVYMENLFLIFVQLESSIVLRKSIGLEFINEI